MIPQSSGRRFTEAASLPRHLCMSVQSAVSTDDAVWKGIDGAPLCTDSTFDNEEEMLFSVKTTNHV